jgi:hypothetical protein
MAGLISGVSQAFGHLGGSSAKTDRSNQLTAFSDLKNVFNWALPFGQQQARTGQATTAAGVQDLGEAGGYFGKLASGDRPTALQAVAPQTNAALAQSDAEKRQLAASGTARGGGTAGFNQQRDTNLMAQIDNMLFGARTAGAQGLAGVGQAESGVGLGETGQGIQAGHLASGTAGELGQQALYSRQVSNAMHRQAVGDYANAFGSVMGGLFPHGIGGLK